MTLIAEGEISQSRFILGRVAIYREPFVIHTTGKEDAAKLTQIMKEEINHARDGTIVFSSPNNESSPALTFNGEPVNILAIPVDENCIITPRP
jgi:hypothetical protein